MKETIVITGASRGIGAAAARALASPDRELVLIARTESALRERCGEIEAAGGHAIYRCVDFADEESIDAYEEWLAEEHPRVDGLVLNAGMSNDLQFSETSRALMEREMAVNFHAPAQLLGSTMEQMRDRGGGTVVVVGSLTAFVPFPGNASYTASKAALLALVRSVKVEAAGWGIHLGVVLPGLTDTALTQDKETVLPAMPPEDVAEAIVECYEQKKSFVVPGRLNKVVAKIFSTFPQTSDWVLSRVAPLIVPSK